MIMILTNFYYTLPRKVQSMLVIPRSSLYLAVALAAIGSSQANAEETTPPATSQDQPVTLAPVVVRASADASAKGLSRDYAGGQVARGARVGVLGDQDMMDTPFTVTSYTQQYIADQQARSVSDVLQGDSAVRMARGYGNFQEVYMIRGFPLYSDDVAYNGLYGLLPRQFVAAELFERVEVFRGASAFVNGTTPGGSGIGGAINLVPKRAPNEALNRITTGFDSGGQAYIAADVARRFGTNQSQGLRLNAVKRDGNTSVEHADRELSLASIGWDMRQDRLRLSADVAFQEQRLKSPRPSVTLGSGMGENVPAAPDADANYAQTWTYSNEATTLGTFRAEYDLTENTTTWLALGGRHTDENNSLANPTVNDGQGTISTYRFDNTRDDNAYTGEVGVRSKVHTGSMTHSLSLAATRYQVKSNNAWGMSGSIASNLYSPSFSAQPSNIYFGGDLDNPGLTQKTVTSSIAFGDTMAFNGDRTLLTLGLRQQHISDAGYDYNSGERTSSYSRGKVTPVAAVVYKITPKFSAYVNYIEALVQGPVASGTGASGSSVSNLGQVFDPYVSRQKEIGLKYDGGRIGGTFSLYTTAKPNGMIDGDVYSVSGKQRNRGLELSTFGRASSSLKLLGGITYMQAKQISTASGAYDGKDAIGAPRISANMGADWDLPWVPQLTLSGRMVYTGAQYADNANTQRVSSWRRYDVGARYPMEIGNTLVTWRANVQNLTNKRYWASAGGYPGSGYLVQGEPRTLSVSASLEF